MGPRGFDLILCWVGKTVAEYARTGISDYLSRIDRYRSSKIVTVPEEPQGRQYTVAHRLEREGRSILQRLAGFEPAGVVVVDARGRQLDSRGFARLVQKHSYEDTRALVFVVGGPDGLAPMVRERADELLGLSRLTLPHDMARLLLAEQIYRAFTIIHGQPYAR